VLGFPRYDNLQLCDAVTARFPLASVLKALDYYLGRSGSKPSPREEVEFEQYLSELRSQLGTDNPDSEALLAGLDYCSNRTDSVPSVVDMAKFVNFAMRKREELAAYMDRMYAITHLNIFRQ